MARSPKAIDVNRALPDLPTHQHRALHSHSSPSNHHRSPLESTARTFVQSSPSVSSKKHLQAVTQRLLAEATPEDTPYLVEGFDPVEPIKFSPPGDCKGNATMTAA